MSDNRLQQIAQVHSPIETVDEIQPVFIGGCGRSGTTLLGAMLGSHSECVATPESKFNLAAYKACLREGSAPEPTLAYKKMIRHWSFPIWDIAPPPFDGSKLRTHRELMLWLVQLYSQKVGEPDARVWIDHTPYNTREAPTLLQIFSEAKIIHMVRDGRAAAASVMKLDWGPNVINRAAGWWIDRVARGLVVESAFGKEKVLRIRYEDLLLTPEDTLQQICYFLDIEYEPQMLEASGFQVPAYTSGQHDLVGKGLDVRRVRAWETELMPREIEIFESLADTFLICLGYQLFFGGFARPATAKEKMTSAITEVARREVVNRMRHRRRVKRTVDSS